MVIQQQKKGVQEQHITPPLSSPLHLEGLKPRVHGEVLIIFRYFCFRVIKPRKLLF